MERSDALKHTMDMVRAIAFGSRIKHGRSFGDFLADRIVQATTEQGLLAALERLAKLMDTDPGEMSRDVIAAAVQGAFGENAAATLTWLREYPRIAAMLCMLKQAEYLETLEAVRVAACRNDGVALPDAPHDIGLQVHCLSPLAHGADVKAGNATIFRRMQVLAMNGSVLNLPFYAGNALRGQMRDLLADDFLQTLGIVPRRDKPPVALWFFHVIYAGGTLEENGKAEKALKKRLGGDGAVRASGIHEFRDFLPALSLLGCALGNRVLSGRSRFADLRPSCRQWGNGEADAAELFEWVYLTRREDHEEHEEHHGMIATTECLRAGTTLIGGIDVDRHARDIEWSALGRGLQLLAGRGYIGAESRRGIGRIRFLTERGPDPGPYCAYLEENGPAILEYLTDLGAIQCTP